jgi:chromosome segregation ATPase
MPAPPAGGSELRRRKPSGAAKEATGAAARPAKPSWARIEKERGAHHQFHAEEARDGTGDGEGEAAVLERESAQLQLAASSDLDAVQRVERQMVDITGLLSQFASLVSDQSAELTHIRSAAESAKGDLDEGRENLAEARERAEASRHYLATLIVALGLLLLLFHWVRP